MNDEKMRLFHKRPSFSILFRHFSWQDRVPDLGAKRSISSEALNEYEQTKL
jgi:hypothetical protein